MLCAVRNQCVDLTGQLSNPQPALCHLAGLVIRPSGAASKAEQHPPKPTRRPRFQTQRRLTADQIAELVEAYRSGRSMKELASEFGIHRTTVRSHLTEHGVAVRRGGPDQQQTAEAVRLDEEAVETVVAVAADLRLPMTGWPRDPERCLHLWPARGLGRHLESSARAHDGWPAGMRALVGRGASVLG
jgi:transposase-like protein